MHGSTGGTALEDSTTHAHVNYRRYHVVTGAVTLFGSQCNVVTTTDFALSKPRTYEALIDIQRTGT